MILKLLLQFLNCNFSDIEEIERIYNNEIEFLGRFQNITCQSFIEFQN